MRITKKAYKQFVLAAKNSAPLVIDFLPKGTSTDDDYQKARDRMNAALDQHKQFCYDLAWALHMVDDKQQIILFMLACGYPDTKGCVVVRREENGAAVRSPT